MISLVANTAIGSLPVAEPIKKPHTTRWHLAQTKLYLYQWEGDNFSLSDNLTIHRSIMTATNSYQSVSDAITGEYQFNVTLSQHEKMLLIIALRDKIEERLKTADFLKNTDSANTYFQDAGRLERIARVLVNTMPKDWLTLSSANNAALFLFSHFLLSIMQATANTVQVTYDGFTLQAIDEAMLQLSNEAQIRVLAALVFEINRFTGDQLHYHDCYDYSHVAPQLWAIESNNANITSEVYKLGARKELLSCLKDLTDHEGLDWLVNIKRGRLGLFFTVFRRVLFDLDRKIRSL